MTESHRDEIAKLEALHAQHPDGRVFTHLAEAYRKAGELGRALETVESGLVRHPEYASAHVVRGRILLDLGQADGARAAFRDVLGLDSHNLIALRALGDLAREAGRPDEALGYYRELLAIDPGDHDLSAEIRRLEAEPTPETVRPALEAAPVAPEPWGMPDAGIATAPEPEGEPDAGTAAAPEEEPVTPTGDLAEPVADPRAAEEERLPLPADAFADLGGSLERAGWADAGSQDAEEAAAPLEDDWAANWWSTEETPSAESEARAGEESEASGPLEPAAAEAETPSPEGGDGTDFHWTFPGWVDEESAAVEVRTETMAALYAAQGLWHRAAEIYRGLLEERPGDAELEARLAEAESRTSEPPLSGEGLRASEAAAFEETAAGGDQWLEGVESAWTGSQGAAGAAASPYDWPEEAGEDREAGPTAGEYLRGLAAWQPGGRVAESYDEPDEVDEGESALREWLAEEPAAMGAEPAGEAAPPQEAAAPGPDGEEDEDVEMFRSWLQSLRK